MLRGRMAMVALATAAVACGDGRDTTDNPPPTTTIGADGPFDDPSSSTGTGDAGETDDDDDDDDTGKLDLPDDGQTAGCEAIDFLFVIDNSESMQTHQAALAEQFPSFIDAMYEMLPDGLSIHVGITTTDFDHACEAAEATQGCQSTASLEEVEAHYVPPTAGPDGGNGTQGKLFTWSGQSYFETTSDDDPAELSSWFSDAALAAGEDGCSFEMPVAAASWAVDPSNADTNGGFVRDELSLLVVFFLTDEPDKSPESKNIYRDKVLAAKEGCGGEACIFMGGLIPACTLDVNQKLWQFMGMFGDDMPPWSDIETTSDYSEAFGEALAGAIAEACAEIPIP